jgi:hypothetical protein
MIDASDPKFEELVNDIAITHLPHLIYLTPDPKSSLVISSQHFGEDLSYDSVRDWILEVA